jgi:predicted RNA binding protein YcfA (HicA-like mRNA interferase family)
MRSVSGRAFARILERHGWQLRSIQGSHHVYGKDGRRERITVPIHGNRDLGIGLLRHLMKSAGLSDDDLS